MENLKLLPPYQQVAKALRTEILAGRWTSDLPAMRPLAKDMAVSVPTLLKAVQVLEQEGIVGPSMGRQRRPILRGSPDHPPHNRALRVGILLPAPLHEFNRTNGEIVESVREKLTRKGVRVDLVTGRANALGRPALYLGNLTENHPCDAWLLVGAGRRVCEWFIRHDIKTFLFGGEGGGLPVGQGFNQLSSMAGAVLDQLVSLGHTRIVTLIPPLWQVPDALSEPERSLRGAYQDHDLTVTNFHLQRFSDADDGLWKAIESVFAVTPPTAIVLPGAQHALGLLSFCLKKRLAIPRDLSVACLHDGPELRFSKPAIARIEIDARKMSSDLTREVHRMLQGRGGSPQPVRISSRLALNTGQSMSRPRRD